MEYKIEIDASRGLVKAEGDKDFVISVIDRYETLMATKVQVALPASTPHATVMNGEANNNDGVIASHQGQLDQFGSVFDVTEDKVSVIADIPGNTQAAKAKNLCLLYLFAKLRLGTEIVQNDEVRDVCKEHAVYDSTNFASQMKSQKKLVIATGVKGSPNFTLKLTVPGKKAAEELATNLEASS